MSPQFTWLTFGQAKQALAARLADPGEVFWVNQELGIYLVEALRTYNALCEQWNQEFAFSGIPSAAWYNLGKQAGSPRLRTVTNNELYTSMEYMLLEPPTGATWTGTAQFGIADLQGALQRRRDQMIQASGCNLGQLPTLQSVPNTRRTFFPDSTLEPRRARFVPDSGAASTMTREDTLAWQAFEPGYLQTVKAPQSWSVITGPPLAMDVDTAPNVPGVYDIICLNAGTNFTAPTAALLDVPDDWSWLAKWGALADLLSRESEATDRQRAAYCLRKFDDGLQVMIQSNWLLQARINGFPVDTPSVAEMDGFSAEWQDNTNAWPSLITAGMDFCAPCPTVRSGTVGLSLTLVGNQPIPALDADFVQVSRDVFDAILDYAQRLASFKMGGEEFYETKELERNFLSVCLATNSRLSKMGIFSDLLHSEGERQNENEPR